MISDHNSSLILDRTTNRVHYRNLSLHPPLLPLPRVLRGLTSCCSYLCIGSELLMCYNDDDDDDIRFICTKIGSCRPLRSCRKKIIIK